MNNFTPYSALLGGIMIGLSVVLYFYTTGRLAGVSGIVENAITKKTNRISNIPSENLRVKRPGTGISPIRWDEMIGQYAERDYKADEFIEE